MVQEAVKTKAPGLRATDFEQKSPHEFGALPIRGKADAEGSSYKAPWCQATARMSLGSTGRYEAGGNVMWLNLVPQGDEARVLAGNPASFEELDEIVSQFFVPALSSAEATLTQPQRGPSKSMAARRQERGKNMARAWQEHGKSKAKAGQEDGKKKARTR